MPQAFLRVPIQAAQANPAPEPPTPQPAPVPPKKPATAAPGEDTGMAGQVAQTEGVVLPAAGAVSATAVFGILGLALVGVAVSGGGNDDSAPSPTSTGTR